MAETLALPTGLKRYPRRADDPLQAHDAADELLIEYAAGLPLAGRRVLVANDSFGALGCALVARGDADVTCYTDSFVGARALELNSLGKARAVSRLEELSGSYDLVVGRIPKNQSFFEDELLTLSRHLHAGSKLAFGSMLKHLPKSAFGLLGRHVGATSTSLARKKARLVFAAPGPELERARQARSPYPLTLRIEGFERPFVNGSNLFSREKLDIGTRFLLENLPDAGDGLDILDLGCGNGIVGIAMRLAHPGARVVFSDESRMAVESARLNYAAHAGDAAARFEWTHCYESGEPASLDLVLCNPPFHQGTTVGDQIAWQMFVDARRALRPGGRLRVVGNSHLLYPHKLRRLFGNAETVAANAKFTVVDALR